MGKDWITEAMERGWCDQRTADRLRAWVTESGAREMAVSIVVEPIHYPDQPQRQYAEIRWTDRDGRECGLRDLSLADLAWALTERERARRAR